MQGLSQNWTWILIVVAIAAMFFLRRGRHGHGGHGHGGLGDIGGFGHGGHGHRSRHDYEDRDGGQTPSLPPPEAVIDPVSGAAVVTSSAMSSVYQGMVYYFASKENRDRFEAAPQDFAGKVRGVPVAGGDSRERHHHRHGGC